MLWTQEIKRLARGSFDGSLIALGVAVYYLGLASWVIGIFRRAPRVLMYHACEEQENGFLSGLGINTPPARLKAQLDFLQKYYQVVPIDALTCGQVPDRAVAITFDDGFQSVHDSAFPLLVARGFPATCYLVTDRLVDQSPMWINELNWFLRRHPQVAKDLIAGRLGIPRRSLTSVFLQAVLDRYDPQTIDQLLKELRSQLGEPDEPGSPHLSIEQIRTMARQGIQFGNHTATHPVLSNLDAAAAREELARAKSALDGLPGAIDSLAYPFGRHTAETLSIARDLGYRSIACVEGDNDPLNPDCIGRVNVGSDSPAVLFARMELVARIKPKIKRLLRQILSRLRR